MIKQITPDGHPDEVWRAELDALPRTSSGALIRRIARAAPAPRLLVVSAHPDDETLGGGRLIADWITAGGTVQAVTATAGEACFDVVDHHHPDLAAVREKEWRAALDVLGATAVGCLGLPDGHLQSHLTPLVERIRQLIDELAPDVVAGTMAADPHPDHQAVGRALEFTAEERSLPVLTWPVWLTYFADPPAPAGLSVVDCSDAAEQTRAAAWDCFTSQRRPVAPDLTAVVPPEMVALLTEQLVLARDLP